MTEERGMNTIAHQLRLLHDSKKAHAGHGAVGQQLGNESYRLVASGNQFAVMLEAADEIDRLTSALSDGPKWIPVTERLPDHADDVLIAGNKYAKLGYYWPYPDNRAGARQGQWHQRERDGDSPIGIVTHWMPLPEAPK